MPRGRLRFIVKSTLSRFALHCERNAFLTNEISFFIQFCFVFLFCFVVILQHNLVDKIYGDIRINDTGGDFEWVMESRAGVGLSFFSLLIVFFYLLWKWGGEAFAVTDLCRNTFFLWGSTWAWETYVHSKSIDLVMRCMQKIIEIRKLQEKASTHLITTPEVHQRLCWLFSKKFHCIIHFFISETIFFFTYWTPPPTSPPTILTAKLLNSSSSTQLFYFLLHQLNSILELFHLFCKHL